MEQRNHTLEPLSLQARLCSTGLGTMWNRMEPPRLRQTSCRFHIVLCCVCITHASRQHVVVLKYVSVSPERPQPDEKLATNFNPFTNKEVTMGLDAYAGFQEPQPQNVEPINHEALSETLHADDDFYWRKHARLQEYMQQLWRVREFGEDAKHWGGLRMDGKHDLSEIIFLEREDIERLQNLVETDSLPFCPDGFFWGHQFQEESMKEYKALDLKFCERALQWLDEGKKVWYDCSW